MNIAGLMPKNLRKNDDKIKKHPFTNNQIGFLVLPCL